MKKILTAIICVLLLSSPALASVFIEQGKVVQSLVPGEKSTGKVVIHNTSNTPDKVKVYWEDFEYEPPYDGSKKFLPAGTSSWSCASWVKFSPQELDLPPYGQATISYVADPPADLVGGRYGVLFFEPVIPQVDLKTGLNIVSRVGTLFFLESTNRGKYAEISNVKISAKGLTADFHNSGNVILIPDGTYYVMDPGGMVVDRGEVPKVYVPSGKTAEYKFDFRNEFAAGRYTIVLTVDLQDQDVLVKEIDFEKDAQSQITVVGVRD